MAEQRTSRRSSKPNPKYYGSLWQTEKKTPPTVQPLQNVAAPLEVAGDQGKSLPSSPEERASSPEGDSTEEEEGLPKGPLSEENQIAIVKKLYKDVSFSGAYAGIQTIQRSLLAEKGLKISQKIIAKALNQFPSYVMVSIG